MNKLDLTVAVMNANSDRGDAGSGAYAEAESFLAGNPTPNRPLEWWQVIENQTAREVSRLRREGRL